MELDGFFLGQLCPSTATRCGSTSLKVSPRAEWMIWALRRLSRVSDTVSDFLWRAVTMVSHEVRVSTSPSQ